MTNRHLVIYDSDGSSAHMVIQTQDHKVIVNIDNHGEKNEVFLDRAGMVALHNFAAKHLDTWK